MEMIMVCGPFLLGGWPQPGGEHDTRYDRRIDPENLGGGLLAQSRALRVSGGSARQSGAAPATAGGAGRLPRWTIDLRLATLCLLDLADSLDPPPPEVR